MEVLFDRPNLRDQIYDVLKKLIVTGQIKPGEKINEENIATTLKVSRTPIRETLVRLEHEGIVEITPRRGAHVVSISTKNIMDILSLREVLEGLVTRLAVENMTDDLLNKLKGTLNKQEAIVSEPRSEKRLIKAADIDAELHANLLEGCDNEWAKNMMGIINLHLQFIRLRTVILPGRMEKTYQEHLAIMEAIEGGDADLAEKLMRDHVESVRIDAWENLESTVEG